MLYFQNISKAAFFSGILFVSVFSLSTSCKKDKPEEPGDPAVNELEINFQTEFNGNALYLDSVYTTDEGYKIKLTDIKLYMEDIRNGSSVFKDVALLDYSNSSLRSIRVEGDKANFDNLSFNIGVQNSLNHNDPSAFPNTSHLNIMTANDMHWGWSPGYIFVKLEGKADTLVDANEVFDLNFVFHIGKDENLRDAQFTGINWVPISSTLHRTSLKIDVLEFLRGNSNPIDLKDENSSHSGSTQTVLTTKLADNFKHALLFE